MTEKSGIPGNLRITALSHGTEQIGGAQAGSFQHIQRAENGGAAGQIRCIEPVRFATKPGEVGQDRFGSRAIVPVRQDVAHPG